MGRVAHVQHPKLTPRTRSVTLDARQRQALLDRYRKDTDPEVRFRAHLLLPLGDGHTWATVATPLFCSSRTIDRWVKRSHEGGLEGLAGHKPGRPFRFDAGWVAVVVGWVTSEAPRDFGSLRSRWCCAAFQTRSLVLALWAGEPYRIAQALAFEAAHVSAVVAARHADRHPRR